MMPAGNIVLCGFMGCGKSTAGRKLAAVTGRIFVDMDGYIEQKTGRTVREMFDLWGESGFRKQERAAAAELSSRKGLVIATGGGTMLDPVNAAALRAGGRVVLLDLPLGCILERLRGDTARPLLRGGPQAVEALYRRRMPVYRSVAHETVTVAPGDTPEQVAAAVLRRIQ